MPGFDNQTIAAIALPGGLSDSTLNSFHVASLMVIKAALLTLCEYTTLVGRVPDVIVETGGVQVPLKSLLEVAAQASDAIGYSVF
jgi:hypothetical protein